MSGMSFYQERGRLIQQSNSAYGKWKIKTSPGKAIFFQLLSEAKKWARKNPVEASPLMDMVQSLASHPSQGT